MRFSCDLQRHLMAHCLCSKRSCQWPRLLNEAVEQLTQQLRTTSVVHFSKVRSLTTPEDEYSVCSVSSVRMLPPLSAIESTTVCSINGERYRAGDISEQAGINFISQASSSCTFHNPEACCWEWANIQHVQASAREPGSLGRCSSQYRA